jgi:hypothetical protein
LGEVADTSLIGTLTRPKLTAPFQMALGICPFSLMASLPAPATCSSLDSPAAEGRSADG